MSDSLSIQETKNQSQASRNFRLDFPFIYFDFEDWLRTNNRGLRRVSDQSATLAGIGNGFAPLPFGNSAAVSNGWIARRGWFTFAGRTNRFFWGKMRNLNYQPALEIGDGCLLIWGQIHPVVVGGKTSTIISVGRDLGDPGWNLQYAPAASNLRIRARDDSGNTQTINGRKNINVPNKDYGFAVYIDNRTTIKGVWFWNQNAQANISPSGIRLITINTIPYLPNRHPFMSVSIGGMALFSGDERTQFRGSIRRLGVINYGPNPPNDINSIATTLILNQAVPGDFLNG